MSSHHSSAHRRMTTDVTIAIVAAFDDNGVIGHEGKLPWHLPADLRHFKEVTTGHSVVMGRKTFESIGKALPGRTNIVLSRRPDYEASGCVVVGGVEEAIEVAEERGAQKIMVIGGAGVFRQFLSYTKVMELTRVQGEYEGDTYFPEFDEEEWEVVREKERKADEENEADMIFLRLERRDGE